MLETFTALAEPNRLRIVELLRTGPRPVGEIGSALRLTQPQTSKHLRVLREAGVVEVAPKAQQRLYALRGEALREMDEWLSAYRALWTARMDGMDHVLTALASTTREDRHARPRRR